MSLSVFEAKVLEEIEFADQRSALSGAQRREQVARRILPEASKLLPEPWSSVARSLGGLALELVIHFIRQGGKTAAALRKEIAEQAARIAELEAELKTAQDAVELAHAEIARLQVQHRDKPPAKPKKPGKQVEG